MRVVLEIIGAIILLWILAFGILRLVDAFHQMMKDRARLERKEEEEE